ncbi:UV DNA damage repair endonuclease UvsE [Paenibacillus arenilitoris]|uniref:UV DNA damage repair endonuclease UvsE n=1 Tax=Paenibacillus arenilitoris TaxID=2772299 RepID=A0A927CS61_9BACL|nr:UV DNA damage repair endonuclease UvsE [Paenibacillus arenilitoris]MBD2871236.1 UV DNA damage repair endonuclease UvsE [Paenibacillus arenilitoris]
MIVRFGFVAMSLRLENASPSKTMTYTTFAKLADREAGLRKLERIAEENLHNTLRILKLCKTDRIQMYRFSSKLIPLATHEAVTDWDPFQALKPGFEEIGRFVRDNRMRVSFHPDHFCVFSTPRPEVLAKSEQDLRNHVRMLEAMGLDETAKCNIHIGGAYGDKAASGERFVRQFEALPDRLKRRVTLENDDKTFTARETLEAAERTSVPMVLDIHHYAVNPGDTDEDELHRELWPRVERTWRKERERLGYTDAQQLPAKIHASSPKSAADPRSHADLVEPEPLLRFLKQAARCTTHLDCMLEAKSKDVALVRLIDDFRQMEAQGVKVRDDGSVEIEALE